MMLLRRLSTLVPAQITTATAPRLGPGTDVRLATDPRRPAPAPLAVRDDGDGCGPLTVPAASRDLPSTPPSYLPGVCYHHGHVDHGGERLGVLVLNDRDASLLPCVHVNRDGR